MPYRFGGNQDSDNYRTRELDRWVDNVTKAVQIEPDNKSKPDKKLAELEKLKEQAAIHINTILDFSVCKDFLMGYLKNYKTTWPILSFEADSLVFELEKLINVLEKPLPISDKTAHLNQLISLIPENADEVDNLSALFDVQREANRESEKGKIDRGIPESINRLVNRAYRALSQKEFGDDPQKAKEELQEILNDVRKLGFKNEENATEETGNFGLKREWFGRFKNWCKQLENELDKILLEQNDVRKILNKWISDINSRPYKVKTIFRKHADVWGVTCQQTVAQRFGLFNEEFDYVIIDEAARTSPLDLLIPLTRARKIILVGDHKQLPHTLDYQLQKEFERAATDQEIKEILAKSLFERLYSRLPKSKTVRLNVQSRMNPEIGRMVSDIFYSDDPLQDAPATHQLLNDTILYQGKSLMWVKISPSAEDQKLEFGHFYNLDEVKEVIKHLKILLTDTKISMAGKPYTIGVITFYAQQRDMIINTLNLEIPGWQTIIQVGSVDAFQGQEKDIIILSMVRSNKEKIIGFLDSPNRLNVALSRARRLLVLIGDPTTLSASEKLKQVFEYCQKVNRALP